jgi:hypothetical protein
MGAALDSWVPSRFASVAKMFSIRRKAYYILWPASWNTNPVFDANSIRYIRTKQHRFIQICRSVMRWENRLRGTGSVSRMGRNPVRCARTMLKEYAKDFRGTLAMLFPEQFHSYAYRSQIFMTFCGKDWIYMPTGFNWSKRWHVKDHDAGNQFAFLHWIGWDQSQQTVIFFSDEATFHVCVWNSRKAQFSCIRKWESSRY